MSQPHWQNPLFAWFSDIRRLFQVQTVFNPNQGLNINQGESFKVEISVTNTAPLPTLSSTKDPVPHIRFMMTSLSISLAEIGQKIEFCDLDSGFSHNSTIGGFSQTFSPELVFSPGQTKKWELTFKARDNYVIPVAVPGTPVQEKHIQTFVEYRLDYERLFKFIEVSNAEIHITPWWGED